MARGAADDDSDLDPDFRDELERMRLERERAEDDLREAFAQSPAVLVRERRHPHKELWILSPETDPSQGKLRVTEFLPDGPYGHISRETLDQIIDEKASTGHIYEPVDEAFVMEWTSTPEWTEGVKKVAYVQAYNRLVAAGSRHGASKYAWDTHMRAQSMDNWEDATALLEQAAADIEAGRVTDRQLNRKKRRLLQL
jgi:hypothetical protein